jgi:hypothetical protein
MWMLGNGFGDSAFFISFVPTAPCAFVVTVKRRCQLTQYNEIKFFVLLVWFHFI